MKNNKVVIVVPVHSPSPSKEELIAFAQCLKVLSDYDIFVVHPKGLDLKAYKQINTQFETLPVNPVWLSSIQNYNRLKCSSFFYQLFSDYEYLLTYELDAFVFRDEILEWCDKNYSYIGAPWFNGYATPINTGEFKGVGNSGFSLRNTAVCLTILKRVQLLRRMYKFYYMLKLYKLFSFFSFLYNTNLVKVFKIKGSISLPDLLKGNFINEDIFWSIWAANTFEDFKLAPVSDAVKFSFEVNPRYLYKLNNSNLPFGCHAWMKYDVDFWEKYIKFS